VRLAEGTSLFQLGWGVHQQRIQATTTSRTNHIAVGIASDKALTKTLLAQAGLPVPKGRVVRSVEEARTAAAQMRGLVAMKPLDGNQGKGVTTAIQGSDGEAVAKAFARAAAFSRRVVVEQHIQGADHRALVIGKELVAAARRSPPSVIGDGARTVRQLVAATNADPRRGRGHEKALTQIPLDEAAAEELAKQGLAFDAVPAAGQRVQLRGNANLSTGGVSEDVTGRVHPDTACACIRAARKIGLDVAGIDLVCEDMSRPLEEQRGAIIEVNAAPGIRMHEHPAEGEPHHVGRAIVRSLFPEPENGRIPIVAVTGTNGKTTTTLGIAHALQRIGKACGVATTEGIVIDGNVVRRGDCTGFQSARTVLTSPEVEVAVLETARGGILKRGLAFDRSDVGVVLNVSDDHLGQDGVDTVQELAAVKGLVVATARRAVVLNADDPHCVGLARRARRGCEILYFSLDRTSPAFATHVARGGRGIYEQDGLLMWADGTHHSPLVSTTRLPSTWSGKARHNVVNAMAVMAALFALGIARERVVAGIGTFTSNELQNPLRLNVYRTRGVTLLVDYAHNLPAYRAVIDTARAVATGRLIGVVSAPGDRRDDDLRAIGALCGEGFDRLVVYEMDDLRRRPPGETARRIVEGATASSPKEAPLTVLDIRQAIRRAIADAEPGDLVVVGCASHLSELRDALADSELVSIDAATLLDTSEGADADAEPVLTTPA
jgi:cyanophycin synthetase